jgi:hypothetical protein
MDSAIIRLRQGLRRHFGPGAECCVDSLLFLTGYVTIDIIRLDTWIQQRNPEYQEDEPLREFVAWRYGASAVVFIEYWIRGECCYEEALSA